MSSHTTTGMMRYTEVIRAIVGMAVSHVECRAQKLDSVPGSSPRRAIHAQLPPDGCGGSVLGRRRACSEMMS